MSLKESLGSESCLCVFRVFSPGVKYMTYNRDKNVKGGHFSKEELYAFLWHGQTQDLIGEVSVSPLNQYFLAKALGVLDE